jgi:peptidoglycan/LPS O-acetylase OafA/YrhL
MSPRLTRSEDLLGDNRDHPRPRKRVTSVGADTAEIPPRRSKGQRGTRISRTLATEFDPRHNSLNALRLVLASLVIVSHAWPIGGFGPDPTIGGVGLGGWAVAGFFGISGFLIAGSRQRSSATGFLWRRFLRIFPGLWICLIVTALAFAPLAAAVEHGSQNISAHALARYVAANGVLMHGEDNIAGTLSGAPYSQGWNGSLWTLFYEFGCYLVLGAMFALPLVKRKPIPWVAFLLATSILVTIAATELHSGMPARVKLGAYLGTYFFAGALLFLCAAHVPVHAGFAAAALAVLTLASWTGHVEAVAAAPLAFLVLWLGITLPLQRVGRQNDISYGVYIYAFPIQQLLVLGGAEQLGVAAFVALGIAATLPLAVASWFVIERPAIALKRLSARRLLPVRAPA